MKRIIEIITLSSITFCLLTSGKTETRPDNLSLKVLSLQQVQDTAKLIGLLKVDSFKLEIIPPSSGVQFFRDGIVFLSNTRNEGKMLPKHVSFGTIEAYTAIVKDTSLGLHMIFSSASSFSFPCEAITFSNDFKTMFYTRIAKKETKEKIYRAELKPDGNGNLNWMTDDKPLDFCNGNYRYTHPALSEDGKMMIFSSDMAGSLGGMDLFIVRKEGEKWSKPENPGRSINTARNECFPYIDKDNNLFFSSDGQAGFGGYDIFTSRYISESWNTPVNLSERINSGDDDIAFSIDKTEGKSAFYTKKKKSEKGEMQLFKVVLEQGMADNNPLTISDIYNGKPPEAKTESVAVITVEEAKPAETEPVRTTPPEVKKEVKAEEKKTASQPAPASSSSKVVIIKPTSPIPDELKDVVVYRIQFLSTNKPRKENQIVVNGVAYKTFEYLYLDAYRYSVGEFTDLAGAKELQSRLAKSGYPQAFVAAFKNNTRSMDLKSFK